MHVDYNTVTFKGFPNSSLRPTSLWYSSAGLTVSSVSSPLRATNHTEKLKLGPHAITGTILMKREGKGTPFSRWRRRNVSGTESFFRPLENERLGEKITV